MKKQWCVSVAAVAFICGIAFGSADAAASEKEPGKPNVILIMADDLGVETLDSYGGES